MLVSFVGRLMLYCGNRANNLPVSMRFLICTSAGLAWEPQDIGCIDVEMLPTLVATVSDCKLISGLAFHVSFRKVQPCKEN